MQPMSNPKLPLKSYQPLKKSDKKLKKKQMRYN